MNFKEICKEEVRPLGKRRSIFLRARKGKDNSNPRVGADRRGGAKRNPFLGSGRPVLRNNGSDRIGSSYNWAKLGLTDQQ